MVYRNDPTSGNVRICIKEAVFFHFQLAVGANLERDVAVCYEGVGFLGLDLAEGISGFESNIAAGHECYTLLWSGPGFSRRRLSR